MRNQAVIHQRVEITMAFGDRLSLCHGISIGPARHRENSYNSQAIRLYCCLLDPTRKVQEHPRYSSQCSVTDIRLNGYLIRAGRF